MLAVIRSFAKSWVAAILIGLLIVSFAVFGINDIFKNNFRDAVVQAGSRTTTSADFKRDFDNYRKTLEQQVGQQISYELAAENGLDKRMMEDIATRSSFAEAISKAGLRPSDKLMAVELQKIKGFFDPVSGRFDKELYQQKLSENGLTPPKFEGLIRDEIAEGQMVAGWVNGLRAPRAYGALGALFELESRDVGFFSLPINAVERPALPTDAQLTKFMNENAERLIRPEFRVLTVVRFSPALVSDNVAIDQKALQERYNFRKDTLSKAESRSLVQIPVKDATTAKTVSDRLAKGEDATTVARSVGADPILYADKPQSAVADPAVAKAAFSMSVGQSVAVKSELGFQVVKVTGISPGHTVTLEEIRPQLEAELRKDATAEKVYGMTQVYDDAHTGGSSLPEAAKKAGVPAMTIGPVTAQGASLQNQPVPGLTPEILKAAFDLPTGGESELQEAGPGEYFAVRVERIIPKAMPPLAEIKPQLTMVWMQREFVNRLQAKAATLVKRVEKGESLEAVASSVGSRVTRTTGLDRRNAAQNTQLSREGLGKAFSAGKGDVFSATDVRAGLIIAKVEAIRAPTGPVVARLAEEGRPQITMALFRELGESARSAARKEIKPKTYPDKARLALGLEPLPKEGAKDKKADKDAKASESQS
jgi:peptidyl-prolyl cis-trans isomerase D